MKLFQKRPSIDDASDASLVLAVLEGDRKAFEVIVARYQRLLCSLAYSSIGSVTASEDVAQEAFVEAWKKLGSLREPEKLKSWLCGILRFKVSHFRRREARQPSSYAVELEEADILESNDERTEEVAMKGEEQALLWQALEKVPETYREPLVLFYREHRSIEHVAFELDLTEDAVKQRLSRGRKILKEGMMQFVEDALTKSTPGAVFTMGVLGALATVTPPAKAATVGATAVQVGSWFKWATVVAFMASVSGLVSSVFALRSSLDQSRTKRERRNVVRTTMAFVGLAVLFVAAIFLLRHLALSTSEYAVHYAISAQILIVAFVISYSILTNRLLKMQRALRSAERLRRPELFAAPEDQRDSKKREYRSRFTLLGIPLVHVRFAMPEKGDEASIGWIAGGDRAYGLLFAWGGIAVAPVSVGILTIGIVSIGAVGFGVVGMGTVGIGLLALGGMAIGYRAYSGLSSMGWESAFSGGFSIAKEAAIGPVSIANEVNNEIAGEIVNLGAIDQTHALVLGLMSLMVIVPVVCYSQMVRKKMRRGVNN